MHTTLHFYSNYSPEEQEACTLYCAKLFSSKPLGIGTRELIDLEIKCLENIVENFVGDQEELCDDLIYIYRTGSLCAIHPDDREIVKSMMDDFIHLCRHRMKNAVGFPVLINALTGNKVKLVSKIEKEVIEEVEEVKVFNESVNNEVSVIEDLSDKEVEKILVHVEKGVENKELMYVQNLLFHSIRVNYAFDSDHIRYRDETQIWRKLMGEKSDEYPQFRNYLYFFKYVDYDILVQCRFFCKQIFEIYKFRRRFEEGYPDDKIVQVQCARVGILLWCQTHRKILCHHDDLVSNLRSNEFKWSRFDKNDLQVLIAGMERLSKKQMELLHKLLLSTTFFESISIITLFLVAVFGEEEQFVEFYERNKDVIKFSFICRRFGYCKQVYDKMCEYIRGSRSNMVRLFAFPTRKEVAEQGITDYDGYLRSRMVVAEPNVLFTQEEYDFKNGFPQNYKHLEGRPQYIVQGYPIMGRVYPNRKKRVRKKPGIKKGQ